MKLSLVIPAYNEEKYIGACLRSVVDARCPWLAEIIVVDNACTDRTAAVARRFPGVRVVREPKKGLTQARQRGLLDATGDLVAYIDADTRVPRGWFDRIEEEFTLYPDLVCLSGPYRYYDVPPWCALLVSLYWKCLAWPTYNVTKYMVIGGNFVAKRAALDRIGGFDTSIAFYGEDTNIARRLHGIGEVHYCLDFPIESSGRRLNENGLVATGTSYAANFLSEAILHRPLTRRYTDVR